MSTDKKIKELEESIKKMQLQNERDFGEPSKTTSPASELFQFFIGLILVGLGLFWVFQSANVRTNFASYYYIGTFGVPNGVVIIPLLIGIVMMFFCKRRIFAWIVTVIGILIILLSILMSVRIDWSGTPLYSFILMFGFIAAGAGLLLKTLFKKRN